MAMIAAAAFFISGADARAALAHGLRIFRRQRSIVEAVGNFGITRVVDSDGRETFGMDGDVGHHRNPPMPSTTRLERANIILPNRPRLKQDA
jgi:hypothetical protein